jgi:ribonucleoside-diphosphate reductase alpha chain
MESYFHGKSSVDFDFSDIREKGSELVVTGGKAPGPAPLKRCIIACDCILLGAVGRSLSPLECHDILCHIADAVLAGGIRRAAMISLFSHDDWEMMTCKTGNWWETNGQRGRANNSVILLRSETSQDSFERIWQTVEASGSGEPGIYWTNNLDWGTNPCAEIALRPYQFCNLVEINANTIANQDDLDKRATAASIIATIQASYTDFHYLREVWQETTEEEALIGVGMTGIASGRLNNLSLEKAVDCIMYTNKMIADIISINHSARCTTIKPSGTSSIVLGCSSGIHAWHNDYYIRRMRVNKDEAVYNYLLHKLPHFVEDSRLNPEGEAILSIPQKAPRGAVTRKEGPFRLLWRVLAFNEEWVRAGHRSGDNCNNVSATLTIKPDEWEKVGNNMWLTREEYNGISVLPYDGGTYTQTPFEAIDESTYNDMAQFLDEIDLSEIREDADYTDLTGELACSGGACEIV